MKEVVARQPVCLLPIGSVEDHGRHLPLDVDNFLISSICEEVARRIPDEVILLPAIPFGFEDHHMSFPGTLTVKPEHLEAFVLDVTMSHACELETSVYLHRNEEAVQREKAEKEIGFHTSKHYRGKGVGRPVYELLGGAHRKDVRAARPGSGRPGPHGGQVRQGAVRQGRGRRPRAR
jgi:creatinine amidohydrolase/Fe(II)-dependent formamide hydrolase-like protein